DRAARRARRLRRASVAAYARGAHRNLRRGGLEPHHPTRGRRRGGRLSAATYPTTWRPPPFLGTRARRNLAIVLALAYCVWAVSGLHIDPQRALAGFGRAADLLARMVPPDFKRWDLLVKGLAESLQMAFASTLVG